MKYIRKFDKLDINKINNIEDSEDSDPDSDEFSLDLIDESENDNIITSSRNIVKNFIENDDQNFSNKKELSSTKNNKMSQSKPTFTVTDLMKKKKKMVK